MSISRYMSLIYVRLGHFCIFRIFLFAKKVLTPFFRIGGTLGSASRAEFPVSLSNHVGFTPKLLYSSTHHSPDSFIHLKTGWAQDGWLQWPYENWYFHLDTSCWLRTDPFFLRKIGAGCKGEKWPAWQVRRSSWCYIFYISYTSIGHMSLVQKQSPCTILHLIAEFLKYN